MQSDWEFGTELPVDMNMNMDSEQTSAALVAVLRLPVHGPSIFSTSLSVRQSE